jgi:protein-S-isoprenylcysteine O-methyltransferase Ste14
MTAGFWWILLSLAVYGVIHSTLASQRVKLAFERWLGAGVNRWYRLGFSIMAGITLLPVLALVEFLPDRAIYTIPSPWSLLTLLVRAAALIGVVYAVSQTGFFRFFGADLALDANSARRDMVVGGLYSYARHPIYTLTFIFLWLAPSMTWNWLALSLGVTAYMIIGSRFEEAKLTAEFGPAYTEYRRRTPAFLPRLTRPK